MRSAAYRLGSARRQVQDALQRGQSLPFEEVLPPESVQAAVPERLRPSAKRPWSPRTTLWGWVRQALEADGSCRQAAEHLFSVLSCKGQSCSPNNSAYCQARKRLPIEAPRSLVEQSGSKLHEQVPQNRLWLGREVIVADGSGASMLDTPANQAAYPQPSTQKSGCGFPVLRFVVFFCLLSGAALKVSIGPLSVSENELFHQLWQVLRSGQVLLGDRLYSSYCDIAVLRARGIDLVARLNNGRKLDWKEAHKRFARNDALFLWDRPKKRPPWLDKEQFRALPVQMLVRIVRIDVTAPGFRSERIDICTTLLDPTLYPAHELARLYRLRWHAELDLRHIKTTLGMDVLACKSPKMVLKDLWIHFLAYNLLRSLMSQAASLIDADPLRLSFKGAVQLYLSFSTLLSVVPRTAIQPLLEALRDAIGRMVVPWRPDRVEPRVIKRRPRDFPRLGCPRRQSRAVVDS